METAGTGKHNPSPTNVARKSATSNSNLILQNAPSPKSRSSKNPRRLRSCKRKPVNCRRKPTPYQKQLADLQKQQNKLVNDQVKTKLQGYQSELNKLGGR